MVLSGGFDRMEPPYLKILTGNEYGPYLSAMTRFHVVFHQV